MAESLPLVSLIIATYNHKKFVRETVAGALSQDYPNLEIVISDDCSPDGTFEILQDLTRGYSGPHKLTVRKNDRNLGLVPHVNKLLSEFAHGEYVMFSGGDDVCLPQTVSFAIERMKAAGVDSIAFNMYTIDAESRKKGLYYEGKIDGVDVYTLADYVNGDYRTSGACRMFKRDIFTQFGPFAGDCQTEDTPNLLRTFLYGKVGFCYVPNICYRLHGRNISEFNSLMLNIDPRKIYKQYGRDLGLAFDKEMISKSEYETIQQFHRSCLLKKIARRRVYMGRCKFSRVLCAISYIWKRGYSLSTIKSLLKFALILERGDD